MVTTSSYNEKDIVVTKGLEGLRLRPAMYIGNLENGRFSILKEILDNALDEATSGFSKKVGCILYDDGKDSCLVYDEGRGIPVGPHPDEPEKSTMEIVFTQLHAGGKLKKGAYSSGSVGTHGIGSSATNALSDYFQAWTFRDGKWYTQTYSKGIPTSKVTTIPSTKLPIPLKKGTIVKFTPDSLILKKRLDTIQVSEYMENCSFLNSGVIFELTDIRGNIKTFKSKGLIDFVKKITSSTDENGESTEKFENLGNPFIFSNEQVDVALQWFESEDSNLTSWVNSNKTIEGGTHLNGLIRLITTSFGDFAKKKNYKPEDLRVGLYGGLNIKIAEPQFDSQTKEKLINPEADKMVFDILRKDFLKYLEKNKSFVKRVIDRANEMRSIYNKFANEKKALSKIKTRGKQALPPPSKFIISNCKDDSLRELMICEGDSAGGSARQARNPYYQEILKLRGKILNTAKAPLSKVYESADIVNILKALGFDPINKEHRCRVGKVIFLTDADVDGCLDGDTRILTLDGKNPTIKELTEKFEKDQQPFYVYSVDDNKNLVVGKAINPRITRTVDKLIELTLSNDEKIKCTLDHKWLVNNPDKNDPDLVWIGNLPYKLAKDLTEKDSIRSVYFENQISRKDFRVISKRIIEETKKVYCLTVPKYHNFMVDDGKGNGICSANSHISTLLLTLIKMYYPELLEQGKVFAVDAPLFIGKTRTKTIYGEDYQDLVKKAGNEKIQSVTRLKGWGESLNFDTLINTDNGVKAIQNITSERVEIPSGNEKPVMLSLYEERECRKIITREGYEISGNPEHPFLVLSKSGYLTWKKMKDIDSRYDYVAISRGNKVFSESELFFDFKPEIKKNYEIDNFQFPKQMTKDLARLLGYFIGDGDGCKTISSGVYKDVAEDQIRCIKSCFPQANPILEKQHICKDGKPFYSITTCAWAKKGVKKLIGDFFNYVGLKGVATTKEIPWSILQSKKEYVAEFLKGLFECDGYVNNFKCEYYTASTKLHDQVKLLLLNFGIITSSSKRKRRLNPFSGKTNNIPANTLFITSENIDIFWKEIGVVSKEKIGRYSLKKRNTNNDTIPYVKTVLESYDKYRIRKYQPLFKINGKSIKALVSVKGLDQNLTYSKIQKKENFVEEVAKLDKNLAQTLEYSIKNHIFWSPVVSNRKCSEKVKQADLSMPNSENSFEGHCYVANGFVVHNCDANLLHDLAFNPNTRKLIRIKDVSGADFEYFKKIVGEDSEVRKQLLESL